MRQQLSFLNQSRFYSPAFNTAIFDGPVRIYFAQYQEPLALNLYFSVQNAYKEIPSEIRDQFNLTGLNIFVMLYPAEDAFRLSFDDVNNEDRIVVERLGLDFVIGVRGPISSFDNEIICVRISEIIRSVADLSAMDSAPREVEEVAL